MPYTGNVEKRCIETEEVTLVSVHFADDAADTK